jgi:hypothetical protein
MIAAGHRTFPVKLESLTNLTSLYRNLIDKKHFFGWSKNYPHEEVSP